MKKSIIKLIPLAMLVFGVASCDSSSDTAPTTSSIPEKEEITTLSNADDFTDCNVDGFLTEITNGRFISTNREYECSISTKNVNKTVSFKVSNPNVLTFEQKTEGSGSITLKGIKAGDSYLFGYDADEMLVLRTTVRVRDAYTPEKIGEALFDYDTYTSGGQQYGWLGDYRINFIQTRPLTAVVKGKDDTDSNVDCECTFQYIEYLATYDCYTYNVTMSNANQNQRTDIVFAMISPTADIVYLYYNPGDNSSALLTWCWPVVNNDLV